MRTPQTPGVLSLLCLLLAGSAAKADPVFSDRLIIKDAAGNVLLDVTRNDATPKQPEFTITSGGLKTTLNAMNVDAGVVLTDPNNAKFISDLLKVTVHRNRDKNTDTLFITFRSSPDEKSLKIPGDFPANPVTLAETGQLQDLTGDLFPQYAKNGAAPPFTIQVQSVEPPADHAPEPASLTLLGLGLLGVSGYAWRKRRRIATR